MSNILVRPLELRNISGQLRNSTNKIDVALKAIDIAILSLKGNQFLGNRADAVQSSYSPKRQALLNAKDLIIRFSNELETTASAFEKADKGQLNNGSSASENSRETNIPNTINEVLKFLDEWTKPVDWIAKNQSASKEFHELFKELGRVLNGLGETRGFIAKMDGLASVLEGSAKELGVVGDLMTLHDFQRYINREITNSEVLRSIISSWIPIPGVSDTITNKILPYLPDPNGKWRGLVSEVESN